MDRSSAVLAVQVSDPGLHAAVTAWPLFLCFTGTQD